jgi:hypothetical protein
MSAGADRYILTSDGHGEVCADVQTVFYCTSYAAANGPKTMNVTTSSEPLLFMLIAVVQEAQTLRREMSVLDLPPDDVTYFHDALSGIEQQAAKFIALCFDGLNDH